jgi:hypothetical protein
MIQPITQSRWLEAQTAELTATSYERENSRRAYEHIFDYLGMSFDQAGRYIVEVGCGAYPATSYCENVRAWVIEPLRFDSLSDMGVKWIQKALEDIPLRDLPQVNEVWLFNCLQHVRDPELRFFEPVDYPTCVYHPHTFTEDDFRRWFGDSVKRYTDRLPGFFDADCCYGTWRAG